jgi:hypothetical protein
MTCRFAANLFVVALLLGAGLPLATVSSAQAGPKSAPPALCPTSVPTIAPLVHDQTTRLGGDPTGLRLCGYASGQPLKTIGKSGGGVLLGPGPAAVVASLIASAPAATKAQRRCAEGPPDVLLRFSYLGGREVDAGLVDFDCPRGTFTSLSRAVVFFASQARSIDPALSSTLVADAGASGLPRPPVTPDLFGYTVAKATEEAHISGFVAEFGGEEVDAKFAPEVVLMQFPPAGMGDIGNELELTLSVPLSEPCPAVDLALIYDGFQGATGNYVGDITIWDVSSRYCRLKGPMELVGTDASGRLVTRSIDYAVQPGMVLSPGAHPVGVGPAPPVGELVAGLSFSTPTAANCPGAATGTIPARWRLSFPQGAVTVTNAGGLHGPFVVDCNGSIGRFGAINLW